MNTQPYEKLQKFVGTWVGKDTMYPSPFNPRLAEATTTYTGALALNSMAVIGNDVQTRAGAPDYLAHKVFGYAPALGKYTFHLFDSTGQNAVSAALGEWDGDSIAFEQVTPQIRIRFSYSFEGDAHYIFRMQLSADGANWATVIEGNYLRTV